MLIFLGVAQLSFGFFAAAVGLNQSRGVEGFLCAVFSALAFATAYTLFVLAFS